eukprot:GFUD01008534.1.p1 GENE.GFUD01008534.1~~GFUD01008534.1.p1  ORF type:complete len:835 (+),score=179.70 GFUD01008534.1:45-2549(+)
MEALIIVNWKYISKEHKDLANPEKDGELMEKLLKDGGYQNPVLVQNEEDMESVVKDFIEKQKEPLERFHFHYSGHGTYNDTVPLDKHNYTKRLTADREFESVFATQRNSVSYGDCMIGSSGNLYLVVDLIRDLLKLKCARWTVTLDMCRNEVEDTRGSSVNESIKTGDSIRKVKLRPQEPIPDCHLHQIAIFHGTSEMHVARDYQSFTVELDTVLRSNNLYLPFLEIPSKVNKNWNQRNVRQRSKVDAVEVGDNWKTFYWPSPKFPILPLTGAANDDMFGVTQTLFPQEGATERRRKLINAVTSTMESLKFVLPKSVHRSGLRTEIDVDKISHFFATLKDYISKLETTAFKTAMMLFRDLITKLENDILPSLSKVSEVNLKATEAFNSLSDKDVDKKLQMSKLRLFCMSYEVLFNEETKTLKSFEFLEPNEKQYLSDCICSEIARLEEIYSGKMKKRGPYNMEKYKSFIDEVDQIKRLSYSTIRKEDSAFEHHGKISKYWTLNKNMVPEGEDDALEGLDCTFESSQSSDITLKFKVYSDLSSNWRVEVVSTEPFFDDLSFSLCILERNSLVPSVYFPEVEKDTKQENVKLWSLDMRHLKSPDKEVTLIFSFAGNLDTNLNTKIENVDVTLWKTLVEKDLDLIRQINEFTVKVKSNDILANGDYVIWRRSMSLVVCNFLKDSLEVDNPTLTSGTLDSKNPWPKYIEPSSVDLLYTRKKIIEARGSVGFTVITIGLHRFAVYWHVPFDFNLYKNSFAIFPLTGQDSSEDAMKSFKNFIDYSKTTNTDENVSGIRGFAKDGPKALEFNGMLISGKMGTQHIDGALQISILPLEHVTK